MRLVMFASRKGGCPPSMSCKKLWIVDRFRLGSDPRPKLLELELALDQERDNHREQRHSFDERREDDCARLNARGHLWLASHAVHRLTGEAADTNTRADYGETGTNAGSEHGPRARVLARERGCGLKDRKSVV